MLMRRVGLVVVASAALLGVVSSPAMAHDDLLGTTPADGSQLTAGPTEVVLTFSEDVQALGTAVLVRDESGQDVTSGGLTIDGAVVTQALGPITEQGTYTTSYRVVSADGHPVAGEMTFTVTGVPGSAVAATPSQPAAVQTAPDVKAPVSRLTSWAWLFVSAVLIVVLAVVNVVRRRRRRSD